MSVDDLVEAYLAGQEPTVPGELRAEFERAMAARRASDETVLRSKGLATDRGLPALPDDYEVVRELGRGGMGVVYLARQRSLGRLVAVKVLRPGDASFGPLVRRFVEEARHLARLRHPNIVSIHETGQAGDEPYFTMDYVEGESLASLLQRGPLSPTQAVRILKQAAEGVEHAHAQGIVHRDLKPANILMDRAGHAFVTDFGLARDVTKASELTGSGDVLGTPAYMAPEQALGQTDRIGEPTDVHALGAILYESLVGKAPYGHGAPAEVFLRLLREEPVPPRAIDRRVPKGLEWICLKALAKLPEARYETVHALLRDLRRFEAGEPLQARGPNVVRTALRLAWRYRLIIALLAFTAFLVLGSVGFGKFMFQKERHDEHRVTVRLAETQHEKGDHGAAVRLYGEAWEKADPADRDPILKYMLRCCGELGESTDALAAWRRLLALAPDRSFGEKDGIVARLLVADLKQRHFLLTYASLEETEEAELTLRRLQVFLAGGTGSADERRIAQQEVDVLGPALHPVAAAQAVTDPLPLPDGTPAELLRIADGRKSPLWGRGGAAFVLGRSLEDAGDLQQAHGRYRQAYESIRSVWPVYSNPERGVTITYATGNEPPTYKAAWRDDRPNTRLLREAHAALRRIDPKEADHCRGGMVFRLEGVAYPAGLVPQVSFNLLDAEFTESELTAEGGMGSVGFQPDRSARVGVADGRYRLTMYTANFIAESVEASTEAGFYAIDTDGAPAEVDVRGTWVDLPPFPVRRLGAIRLIAPEEGARVDLREQAFRWEPVEGAAKYEVTISSVEEKGRALERAILYAESPSSPLCFADLPRERVKEIAGPCAAGHSAQWYVRAYDDSGRILANSSAGPRIFIERALDGE